MSFGFWLSWAVPLVVVATVWLVATFVWRKQEATIELSIDRFKEPLVAGVSVLAIAIPISANLLFQAVKDGARGFVPGLLLAGLSLASVSLLLGAFLIYKVLLEAEGCQLVVAPNEPQNRWVPPAISTQLAALIGFLFLMLLASVGHVILSSSERSPPFTAVERKRPFGSLLGMSVDEATAEYGRPDHGPNGWMSYQSGRRSVLFCFSNGTIAKLIETPNGGEDALRRSSAICPGLPGD